MKVEVINLSTEKPIETYFVPGLTMLDFQEWKELNEVVINLGKLSEAIANLDSKDLETNEPISSSPQVDFYLPDPIKNRVFSQLAKSETDPEGSADPFRDGLNEVTERVSTPALKSSTILSAVVTEILQNHHPHPDYKVRISHG